MHAGSLQSKNTIQQPKTRLCLTHTHTAFKDDLAFSTMSVILASNSVFQCLKLPSSAKYYVFVLCELYCTERKLCLTYLKKKRNDIMLTLVKS